ncbi:hypothetical protein [Streptomyces sp. NPDC050355]|uniref:hypothetical protein n=1 Tax=Streptomyces sp. NPDC050355 TaxID=3365609 RepID=UPI00379E6195
MPRRRSGAHPADDNTGWTMDRLRDNTPSAPRSTPSASTRSADHHRAVLAEEARNRRMTLLEYVGWVGRMPQSELHVYRDRVRSGSGGPRPAEVYDAWLSARMAVREMQTLQRGWGPGEPDRWI